ncbi:MULTISPECIES: HNH/ENDO VII family nuclease [Pseudomonas]|uniref:HNH/ENDO VII family nuclease n=1 Tax=Pseudomonas psychrophila TaxID=122355 RepID=A0A8I1FS91_9PSED|nr:MULTISPECIES: HNH/ENDO VII family nuclease [Pseudomonas]MBJ2258079.1 HNH/ENDO VII family nuclease [Pseudomonas psychrophila]MDY7580974.1 HNH/ENDO VII family nuclease [Pseudomonas sp. CCI3.1]MEB0069622.1 HNH/ENDO VII family nuclease [Pseudomonas sp. CCI3.1]MEB0071109.1 HNH/ENDO VII family nuclease [Pseudomonas sp. CCI1.4]
MKLENFASTPVEVPSALALLAREMPDKCIIIAELDLPIVLTQDNRLELPPISAENRERLKDMGIPTSVLDAMGSEAEARIYEDANLEPAVVNGRDVLIRTDIDYEQEDFDGNTNLERMKMGKAPLDATNRPIELHHIGQQQDSPLAELTCKEHSANGNDNVLHNKQKESEINREDFSKERKEHWKARAEQVETQRQEAPQP